MRNARRLLVLAPALAAALTFPMTPAHAGEWAHSTAADNSDCADPADGRFWPVGEKFTARDRCIDGDSGVLLVDIYPWENGNSHDRKVWAHRGSGDSETWNASIPEGRPVAILACTGQYSSKSWGGCDSTWRFGKA
ncbi:hypothetical protein GCM10009801_14210 [Streptomyces albiaxialis]|uniref:Secreted protein n=1 Tax=Streptomyces albiaxialis TaxID=329523 RepID=A0ABN2VNX8_9ACTN